MMLLEVYKQEFPIPTFRPLTDEERVRMEKNFEAGDRQLREVEKVLDARNPKWAAEKAMIRHQVELEMEYVTEVYGGQ